MFLLAFSGLFLNHVQNVETVCLNLSFEHYHVTALENTAVLHYSLPITLSPLELTLIFYLT